jgi:large subunit ribosomal protein L7/L12
MATKDEKIKALEQKQAQIKARIQALKARDTAQERKDDTRRKILVGGVVLKLVKNGSITESQLAAWLDSNLNTERDRALFGLAAKPAISHASKASV